MPSGACSSIRGGEGDVLLVSRMSVNGELATRARPLKPHETEPFLTVGLADINTYGTREKSSVSVPPGEGAISARGRPGSGDSRHSGGQGDRSTVASTGAVLYSLYMSQSISMGKENRGSEGPGTSRLPGSTFSSSHTPNPCIKMPFKHDIRKPSQTQWQEPAQDLKEMTALATYHMTQMLAEDGVTLTKKQRGRLQKGKLKPLYPVDASGPSINQCRGILAETRSYSASASRTLQRRRHIVSQLKSGALKLDHKSPPHQDGTESVHRVSAASSVEDLVAAEEEGGGCEGGEKGVFLNDDFQAELASMERDAMFEMEDKESSSKDETEETKDNNLKEAEATPLLPEQGVSSKQNPDLGSPYPNHPSDSKPDTQKREEGRKDPASQQPTTPSDKVLKNSTSSNNGILERSERENQTQDLHTQEGNPVTTNGSSEKNTSHIPPVKARRPVSAGVDSSFSPLTTLQVKTRPQTAASSKTVRFADHAHSSDGKSLPVSRSNTWMGKGRGKRLEDKGRSKERKSPAGESCKPFDLDKNGGDDKDEDEGQGKGGKNNHGGGRAGNGRTGSGSTKATPQGGNRGQVSGSHPSPQDVEDIPCFSNLTPLLQSLSEEPKPVSLVHTSENQPSTLPQRNGESRTVCSDRVAGIDLLSTSKADESLCSQGPSDPQKLSIYQEDENDLKPNINSSLFEKMSKRGFTLCGERMCLRKLSSELGSQKLAQSHDSQKSVCQFCGKDIVGHRCSSSADCKHRSVLRGNSLEWNTRDGWSGTKVPEGHFSPSVQLWTWLGLHFPHRFSSLLVL